MPAIAIVWRRPAVPNAAAAISLLRAVRVTAMALSQTFFQVTACSRHENASHSSQQFETYQ